MFTPVAMILAQTILVTPIVAINMYNSVINDIQSHFEFLSLIKSKFQYRVLTLLYEYKNELLICFLVGFGRCLSEVGAVMIVGGNIDQFTRVMTTSIVLETAKGNISFALQIGGLLICISLLCCFAIYFINRRR